MIKLQYLRYFVAVAEEKHFGRAARRVRVAQPALSQQIQRLEAQVGHQLFRRRPRVELTEAGKVLLRVARRTLEQVEEGVEAARRAGRGELGRLTVGFAASVILTELAGVIRAYRQRFPDVDLQLRELSTGPQLEALRAGTLDIGFLREPKSVDDALIAEPILQEGLVIALPPGHRLSSRRALGLDMLADEPFVLFPRRAAPGFHDDVLSICRKSGFTPRVVQEAREWLTIVCLVEAGLGVSIVPASFEKLRWGGVAYRRVSPASPLTTITLCMPRDGVPAVARGFAQLCREMAGDVDASASPAPAKKSINSILFET